MDSRQKIFFITLSFVFCSLSCTNSDDVLIEPEYKYEGINFLHSEASSREECDRFLEFGVNCIQIIEFKTGNKCEILVTDIINDGIYTFSDNRLTIELVGPGDIENPMIFQVNEGGTELKRISDGSNDLWKKPIAGVAPWDL